MSRSNPHVNAPNPAVRWFEWNGEHGLVRYYDKEAQKNIDVALPFTFLLLDELATVKGWHEASKSGIYANEVRDTRTDVMVVKAFKGGTLAEGLYKDIKDRVNTLGGSFVANCYVAFKQLDTLAIGSLRFKGAALGAWMEFRKSHRNQLYEQAVNVTGYTEGKKGRITFRVPTFELQKTSEDSKHVAMALDKELQAFLAAYFGRRTSERTEASDEANQGHYNDADDAPPLDDSDIPFAWMLPLIAPLAGALLAAHGLVV